MKSDFEIELAGSPVVGKDIGVFERRVHGRILKLDPNAQVERTSFARLRFRFRWYGEPINIEKIDDVHKSVLKYMEEYLRDWEYRIEVNYHEREV